MQSVLYGVVIVVAGTVLLRVAGRRSVAQMTFGSVMVMLALGTIIATPVVDKRLSITLASSLAMILTLIILEWMELKFNWFEHLLSGSPVVVIEDGVIREENLRKLRLTVDKLEMRLRQSGIIHLSDVKKATVEANGQLGYELQPGSEPLTTAQFERALSKLIPELSSALAAAAMPHTSQPQTAAMPQTWTIPHTEVMPHTSQMPQTAQSENIFSDVEQATDREHARRLQ